MSELESRPLGHHSRGHLAALWSLVVDIWEIAIWGDVQAGGIDLHDSPMPFKASIRLGAGLVALLAALLPFMSKIREVSPLLPLAMAEGQHVMPFVPFLSIPLFYGLLAVAWAYLLTGAFGATDFVRGFVLVIFVVFVLGLLPPQRGILQIAPLWPLVAWGSLATLVIFLVPGKRWHPHFRGPSAPAVRFSAILALCAGTMFGSLITIMQGSPNTLGGIIAAAERLAANMDVIVAFLVPFFLLAGGEVAGVAIDLGTVGARWLAQNVGTRLWTWGLGGFLLLRLIWVWLYPLYRGAPPGVSVGAAGLTGIILLAYGGLRRWGKLDDEEEPSWMFILPALLLIGPLPIFQGVIAVTGLVSTLSPISLTQAESFRLFLSDASSFFFSILQPYVMLASSLLVVAGIAGWLRKKHVSRWMLFFVCMGTWVLAWRLTRPTGPLGRWTFDVADIAALGTTIIAGLFFVLWVRRRLSPSALSALTAAALILWLLGAHDLLSDPLSPLMTFVPRSGPLFLAVSLLLSVAEAGEYFGINEGSLWLPRQSRVFLFVGYALLASLFAHWEAITNQTGLAEGYANTGYLFIGIGMVITALLALSISAAVRTDPQG